MAVTDISICSAALQLLGDDSISSFSGSDRALRCGAIYPLLKLGILAQFDWNFTKKKAQLTQNSTAPISKWTYSYALPPDRLDDRVIAAFDTNAIGAAALTSSQFEIHTGVLLTDAATVYVDYQGDPASENVWPSYFVWFMIKAMEVALTFPTTDQASQQSELYQQVYGTKAENGVGGLYAVTRARNSGGNPTPAFTNFSLIDARYEGIN